MYKNKDKNGDGSVEKDEFEQVKQNKKDLNQNLVNIFEKKFQQGASSKVTYERMFFAILKIIVISILWSF